MESAKEKWGWLPKSKITGDAVSPKAVSYTHLHARPLFQRIRNALLQTEHHEQHCADAHE